MRIRTKDKYDFIALRKIYEKIKNEIILTAILHSVYTEKLSNETIQTKVTNQFNAIEVSIQRINPKFKEKSKHYDKINQQTMDILKDYEANLIQFCKIRDAEIHEAILKKVELESKLLMATITKEYLYQKNKKELKPKDKNIMIHGINSVVEKIKLKAKKQEQVDVGLINRIQDGQDVEREIEENMQLSEEYKENQNYMVKLQKEIKTLNQKIKNLNEQKANQIFSAMEAGDKALSTQIRKPRTFKKITKFFSNRFNTYNVIIKSVIEPIRQRIDEFKVNILQKVEFENKEFDLKKTEEKIRKMQEQVLKQEENEGFCKKTGIL